VLAGGRDSGPRAMRAVDVRALIVETMLHKNVDDAKTAGRRWNYYSISALLKRTRPTRSRSIATRSQQRNRRDSIKRDVHIHITQTLHWSLINRPLTLSLRSRYLYKSPP